eukprot:CAMPEP_0196826616 /NCGR_PEP_ID=MMETSP1362-20130617/93718_1 /TAXON_ID=163516 /ORGANISM="Leptocylindrus danicus, Strain CCMP1856" /LENGTH=433 /DNA_ID=CAMNT_0042207195 /DNA_START=229 /DNA_END=1532 /DNA_ORIENTATION=+
MRKAIDEGYFAVPGVAYECPVICSSDELLCEALFCSPLPAECNRISFCTEPLTNDDLLQGSYDVVFYMSSSNMSNESLNRTVKGKVEFSMKSRRSDSALHIHLILTEPFLKTSSGKYIEVTDQLRSSTECLHTEKEFFSTIFPNQSQSTKHEDFESALGRRNFVTQTCNYKHKEDWWNELHKALAPDDDDDDYWSGPAEYLGFALKRISKRVSLGISRDHPSSEDSKFHSLKLNTNHLLQKPDCNELAEELIAKYCDGSNSWMYTHLEIPSSIAFQIRVFITPPPVFYLEEGDLAAPDDDDDDYWNEPAEYRGFVLKRISKRVPLGISRDYPSSAGSKFYCLEFNTNHLLQKPDCNKIAEEIIGEYRDGSNSWMCTHLQIPSSIAFQIRAFITPPPVFYLEEGDLVLYGQFAHDLDMDTNFMCESFIIRKKAC